MVQKRSNKLLHILPDTHKLSGLELVGQELVLLASRKLFATQ